jgi:hypothetical protein
VTEGRTRPSTGRGVAFWLALSLWVSCVALAALGILFAVLNSFATGFSPYLPNLLAGTLSFSTVGALIASRRPENPIGWLLCVAGLLWGFTAFGGEYGYALATGTRPGGVVGLWFGSWTWFAAGSVVLFAFLFFPDGRLPSPRWRVLAWLYVLASCLEVAPFALAPGPLVETQALGLPHVANPFGLQGLAGFFGPIGALSLPLTVFTGLAPVVALSVRFRRAGEEGRQQIKWVAYAVALLASVIITVTVWPPLDGSVAGLVLFLVGFQAIPAAIGIAVLRYRLFDVDVLINRTLVYGALTGVLVAVYVISVVALQTVFRALTGEGSQLVVVASTLAIAALFNPLRRRIQGVVDRRFYRNKYDATRTLEAFAARLRDETDLERLGDDLERVVRDTMQPEHVSLWLKPPERQSLTRSYERVLP